VSFAVFLFMSTTISLVGQMYSVMVAEEITLLCDMHHREKTNGLLPLDHVVAANREPFNLRRGVSKPYNLHYSGTGCETIIGSNRFILQTPAQEPSASPSLSTKRP
jgi:hypothetical protein